MPKMKTRKSLAKRIKVTGTGKIRRYKAGKRHLMSAMSSKRRRRLKRPTIVTGGDARRMKRMLGLA